MYQPAHFVQSDPAVMAELMRLHPLATLARSGTDGGIEADVLPLLWLPEGDGRQGRLQGHVARPNPLWREADGGSVLAMFHGPQGYVSPSLYPSKAHNPKVVPTWNYALVQARGSLRAIDDADWLHDLLTRLTQTHETGRAVPWQVTDAPQDYLAAMLRGVVGIEIRVDALTAKFKLSQNRAADDRRGVIQGTQTDPDLAAWMRRHAAP